MKLRFLWLALIFGLILSGGTQAQGINLAEGESAQPLEVFADNGIEWQQGAQVIIAQGNAVAKRGTSQIQADELRAFYTETPDGTTAQQSTDVHRLEALGAVTLSSPSETVTGDKAVYDLKRAIMVMTGQRPTLKTPDDVISADDTLEYWEHKNQAVARGNATAQREDRIIHADILVALLQKNAQGKSEVHKVNAFDNVRIQTPEEEITAEKGVYTVQSAIATLYGAVKIRRGQNLLNGCAAEVNLKTNVSRLFACDGTNDGRVRGLVLPSSKTMQ